MATLQSGILAERFAPGFDRYFFSLRSERAWPGWARFDGKKLRSLRLGECCNLEEYSGVIENNLVFYVPRIRLPALLGRLETLVASFRVHAPLVRADVRKQLGRAGISVRNAEIHRNSWGCVVNGAVHIEVPGSRPNQDAIRRSSRSIVRKAVRQARRRASRLSPARYLPLGFARVAVFEKNHRKRRLASFGLGSELVCTVQVKRLGRIRSPDIFGSSIEQQGKFRIAWNKAWLETSGGGSQAAGSDARPQDDQE